MKALVHCVLVLGCLALTAYACALLIGIAHLGRPVRPGLSAVITFPDLPDERASCDDLVDALAAFQFHPRRN